MDLNSLEIEVRERRFTERIDMTLMVIVRYWQSILAFALLGILPFAFFNFLFVSLIETEYWEYANWVGKWLAICQLMLIQAAFAMIPLQLFLSRRIFGQDTNVREVLRLWLSRMIGMVWVHGIMRLGGLFLIILLVNYSNHAIEAMFFFFIVHIGAYICFYGIRPYVDFILYLERLPFTAKNNLNGQKPMTVALRSQLINRSSHLNYTGESSMLWLICLAIALAIYGLMLWIYFVLAQDTVTQNWFSWSLFASALWISQVFATVFRFISYLDCRIRAEGWELEIRMKIEGQKLEAAFYGDGLPTMSAVRSKS